MANDLIQKNRGRMEIDVLSRMKSIMIKLMEKRRNIEQIDKEIIDKSPLADIDKEIDERTEVSTKIIETRNEFTGLLDFQPFPVQPRSLAQVSEHFWHKCFLQFSSICTMQDRR